MTQLSFVALAWKYFSQLSLFFNNFWRDVFDSQWVYNPKGDSNSAVLAGIVKDTMRGPSFFENATSEVVVGSFGINRMALHLIMKMTQQIY